MKHVLRKLKVHVAQPKRTQVLKIHVSEASSSATCEILVHLPAPDEPLKVVDVIEYVGANHGNLKIKALRAYKG